MTRQLALLISLLSPTAFAGSFGVYDARSQAMGTAAVAVGDVGMAAGHNPALLGLFDEDEDKSRNGRFYISLPIPNGTITLSQVAIDALEILQDEPDIIFDDALQNFNDVDQPGDPNAETQLRQFWAGVAGPAARELEDALIEVANKDIHFSGFLPIVAIAEPGELGGGGFYFGTRLEGGGSTYIPDDDVELFHNYVEALDNVASGGYWRDVHPELFNADPNYVDFTPPPLNDPFDDVESRADLRGFIINEVAVAGAKGFDFDRMRLSIGATPKVMQVRVFDESREVSNEKLEIENTTEPHLTFNMDIGVAIHFDSGIRLGYTGKDLFRRTYETTTGSSVTLQTKHRLGFAYIKPNWQVGLDYDMSLNQPVANELTSQFLALGGEYTLFKRVHLRAGYQYDTEGNIPSATSFGLGVSLFPFKGNISYIESEDEKGVGLQWGFVF